MSAKTLTFPTIIWRRYTGFDGVYCADADMDVARLIPLPAHEGTEHEGPDELLAHVEREHSAVPHGEFGASRTAFTPWNYQVCHS